MKLMPTVIFFWNICTFFANLLQYSFCNKMLLKGGFITPLLSSVQIRFATPVFFLAGTEMGVFCSTAIISYYITTDATSSHQLVQEPRISWAFSIIPSRRNVAPFLIHTQLTPRICFAFFLQDGAAYMHARRTGN